MVKFVNRVSGKLRRINKYLHDMFLYWCINYDKDTKSGVNFAKYYILKLILRGRKTVGFYGECHMNIYTNVLCSTSSFKKKYVAIGANEIEYLLKWHSKNINKKGSWDKLDVLIYNQNTPTHNGAPALNQVLSWTTNKTELISVTNAAFKGYMPQHTKTVFENNREFIWGDKNLNEYLDKHDFEIGNLESEDYYSKEYVLSYYNKSLNHMKKYETMCTIKISDYIEEKGMSKILYNSTTHPTIDVLFEITMRIANALHIESPDLKKYIKYNNSSFDLVAHGEVVYPSVWKHLGIQEKEASARKIQPGDKHVMFTFHEYIHAYINAAQKGSEAGL